MPTNRPLGPLLAPSALIALLLALPPAAAAPLPAPAPAGSRHIALEECRLTPPGGAASVPARCGHLEVPEDPSDPKGRHISLAVAVVPALDVRSHLPPLFVVAGGPGQSASDFYSGYFGAFAPVARTRAIVLVDQRGTGGSNRLTCSFPDDFDVVAPPPEVIRELSRKCRDGLSGKPEFYTSSVAIRDLDAVRSALGYERIALYGVSYGTRVVEHYLRHYPTRAAAIVLDGVMQPDRALGAETPLDAERALDIMFARCHATPTCETAFPDLAHRFELLLADLGTHTHTVSVPDPTSGVARSVVFDHEQFTGAVRLLNYYSVTTALLPLFIDRASKGDYSPLASELLLLSGNLDEQLAYGMNAAVACAEDVTSYGNIDRHTLERTYLGAGQLDELATLCEGWPRGLVDADLFAPLHSAVPALLLSGEADPVTPPSSAARAAQGFSDVLAVVVAGQGHGQLGVGCAPWLIARFLNAGTTHGLDASCLATVIADPFVLGPTGPAP